MSHAAIQPDHRHASRYQSKDPGNPNQKIGKDLAPIQFVKHLMPPAGIEIVRDTRDTGAAIAVDERAHSFQSLPNWIVASGENVYGKVLSYFTQFGRISKPRERIQERLHRRAAERRKAERISDEGIYFRAVPA